MPSSTLLLSFVAAGSLAAPIDINDAYSITRARYSKQNVQLNADIQYQPLIPLTPSSRSTESTTMLSTDRTTDPERIASPTPLALSSRAASTNSTNNAWQDHILSQHNRYRALHVVDALAWSSTLEEYAANHVESCVFAHSHGMV